MSLHQLLRFIKSHITSSHTMRFSCAIAFALVVACASSVSALPTDTEIGTCPIFCYKPADCSSGMEDCHYMHRRDV
ncbi:hypothetical protein EDD22DRAFT_870057, partial [Suillus occidentalis]